MREASHPPQDSPAKHFLDVMLRNEQYYHCQYLQAPGNARLSKLADFLVKLGYPVKYVDRPNPSFDPAIPVVRVFYIGEHSLASMMGEE